MKLTHARVRELFRYNPRTGRLTWRVAHARWNARLAGIVAGTRMADGALQVSVAGRYYRVHRLIWLYVYGRWPTHEIDHRNGDPADNRLSNLRGATRMENAHNLPRQRTNRSGYKGVSRAPHGGWRARIKLAGREIALGCFPTPRAAAAAYDAAARHYHGAFARGNGVAA